MIPLGVALYAGSRQRVITPELVRSLQFSSSAPGGFKQCSFAVPRSLRVAPWELAPLNKVQVFDTRTGAVCWQGRLDDPGREAGPAGELYNLSATGSGGHARESTAALVYVDKRLDAWQVGESSNKNMSFAVEDETANPGQVSRLVLSMPRGTVTGAALASFLSARYYGLLSSLQKIGRLSLPVVNAGRTVASLELRLVGRAAAVAGESATTVLVTLTASTSNQSATSAPPAGTHYLPEIQMVWNAATSTIADDVTFWTIRPPVVQGNRLNQDGTAITSYPADTLVASQVVADLLGRLLTQYDGTNALVSTAGVYAIDQLAYEDGTTAAQVLEDLMKLEPAFFWAAWEDTATGKARFEWSAWPTTVAYELDAHTGFTSAGSISDVYDSVAVRYKDHRGQPRVQIVAASNRILTAAGLSRRARMDLGGQTGTAAQATRAGQQFLAQHATPTNNGTIGVSEPLFDYSTRRTLMPHELKPGVLVRVRNLAPYQDALNPTTTDGVAVFRCTNVDYADGVATLTLDADDYTVSGAISKLARAQGRFVRP